MNNLAPQKYWNANYENTIYKKPGARDPLRKLLTRFFQGQKGRVLEIGCYPGSYLSVFGDLGFELSGVDLTPRVRGDFLDWLKNNGYRLGSIEQADFFAFQSEQKYDVVCSFGFIEHFTNYLEVISKHLVLLESSGCVVITCPNFRGGVQKFLHKTFDGENFKRHNIEAMNPLEWKAFLEKQDFEILYCGWFGGYDFWIEKQERSLGKTFLLKVFLVLNKILRLVPVPNSEAYSPFCGLVARKKRV